jgi:hypothetical protein
VRCGRSVADPSDDRVVVEAAGEVAERPIEFGDGPESLQPGQLFLQHADESLDASVAFRLPDEGRTRLDAEGLELVLEGVRDELAAVVAAELRRVFALAFFGSARAPRSPRRRRRLVSWPLRGVVHSALESQMGVSGNCAPHHSARSKPLIARIPCSSSGVKTRDRPGTHSSTSSH